MTLGAQGNANAKYALPRILSADHLQTLVDGLKAEGFVVVGPTVRDGAIVLDELDHVDELPQGLHDETAPGRYRLEDREDALCFGFALGPHHFKRWLVPASERLLTIRRHGRELVVLDGPVNARKLAFFGARGCDVAALGIQDRVLVEGRFADPRYAARRADNFIVAVDCHRPAETCFCGTMGTGPVASAFDLRLAELPDPRRYVIWPGSPAGEALLARLPTTAATERDLAAAADAEARSAEAVVAPFSVERARTGLAAAPDHPHWDAVAARCLACTSCTQVCPTCFCSAFEDTTTLGGDAVRTRRPDSCFSLGHSHLHGSSVHMSVKSRYRQWLTHKLSTWHDQFGTAGCVGCGRCIAWCPAGIDLRAEAAALSNERTSC